ncbi:hypothetical protein CTA2_10025 [Colletotrichum tanaceti]|uniref:Extracellular membrane protein CFEM domain-containing protein n=1 Tax=Colletotrichum tanaceti TaxID=1306861 RepID=A0A4V6DHD4_9PEZI|nr:hypothetical protein CTA2_10025 [Colletotrichum tanaceti]TKW56226.1 hypothetical protein CTA1_3737 [Colletotrichum tanaceti]
MMNKLIVALAMASAATAVPSYSPNHGPRIDCMDAWRGCIANGFAEVACSCTLATCSGQDNARSGDFCATATANLPKPTKAPGIPGVPAEPVAVPDPKPVQGKEWTIQDLSRYCGESGQGCDYNFVIQADGQTQRCTVIRMPGANAATEDWYDQPCTAGSEFKISWGYVETPAPGFAVITVVKGKELAWFGVPDVNGKNVTTTPSNPYGSGQFGNIGPEQVYTY